MTPIDMIELHNPPEGIGDCLRASVASILDLPAEDVPHFVRVGIEAGGWDDPDNIWWETLLDFLWDRKLWLENLDRQPPRPHLAGGPSPRGTEHCVAVDADGTVHDPHPSRAGLLEVTWRAEIVEA